MAVDPGAHRGASAWYEVDPSPVLMVGAEGAFLDANPAGRQLLASESLTSVRGGRVVFIDPDARRVFQARLHGVLKRQTRHEVLVLRGDNGEWRRVELSSCPQPEEERAFVVFPTARAVSNGLATLTEAFGLTPGEARTLDHVLRGAEPGKIATLLGVSTSTVRNQLRSLYVKMHVKNLQGLVRQCARLTGYDVHSD